MIWANTLLANIYILQKPAICFDEQLTGSYMKITLSFYGLIKYMSSNVNEKCEYMTVENRI